jgi:AcrR family transcriptional regulator
MVSTSGDVLKPPRQSRSRQTFETLLDAAERLLRTRSWDEISIVDITDEAGCSNGAVYGRFKNKDELLVALYDRHDAQLKERFAKELARRRQADDESLEAFVDREIDQHVNSMRKHRWLLRAAGELARRKPEVVSKTRRAERKAMFEKIGAGFLRFEDGIDHPDPDRGVELIIFFIATIVRETVLHPGPHCDTLKLSDRELKASLKRLAMTFLGAPPP